jgi:adenine-specific DNA methylase
MYKTKTITVDVDVDIDLDDFTDEELYEELQAREFPLGDDEQLTDEELRWLIQLIERSYDIPLDWFANRVREKLLFL